MTAGGREALHEGGPERRPVGIFGAAAFARAGKRIAAVRPAPSTALKTSLGAAGCP